MIFNYRYNYTGAIKIPDSIQITREVVRPTFDGDENGDWFQYNGYDKLTGKEWEIYGSPTDRDVLIRATVDGYDVFEEECNFIDEDVYTYIHRAMHEIENELFGIDSKNKRAVGKAVRKPVGAKTKAKPKSVSTKSKKPVRKPSIAKKKAVKKR